MKDTIDMLTLQKRVKDLERHLKALAANNDILLARQTALHALVNVLLWGVGKSRKEMGDELIRSGKDALAAVNTLPEPLQKEVAGIWNDGYAKLMGPSDQAFQVGKKPT